MIIRPISIFENSYSNLISINETNSFYNEDWLQRVIYDNPQTYPIENPLNIDLKIVSLGREVITEAGYIDILLLTSDAELIIVETKLWKNPEKSRTVLAQVIDYAKAMRTWSYDDLDNAVISSQRSFKKDQILSVSEIVKKEFPTQNHTNFIDSLCRNLHSGVLKLSIIGDKISPNLLLLSETIQSAPGLNFSLSLIEMKLFKYNDVIILIPDIVGKTLEVVRGVVKVQYEQEKPKVEITYLETEINTKSQEKTNRETFISQCPEDIAPILENCLDEWQNNQSLIVNWGVIGLSVRKLVDYKYSTIIEIYPTDVSMIIQTMAEKCRISNDIYEEYLEVLFSVGDLKSAYSTKKKFIKYNNHSTEDIELIMDAVRKLIIKTTDQSSTNFLCNPERIENE